MASEFRWVLAVAEGGVAEWVDAQDSACGYAGSASGPFYGPGDQKVYLDLDFFRQFQDRFKAPGNFAQAYVIAYEVDQHVQTTQALFIDTLSIGPVIGS